ncbi:ABC transporter permease [Actinacidiphila bryophytorum]|uniref:ABC-2 type transport system permease protein n=1 Tax=Actinacidiphila bryophytorum TaxID=1436133 RepID=A0A9W4EDE1_9ACTN|nr:ABC transporter permease [Actinacidiphila bryophytorum]CAG7621076.1 ABC-2 type transport system permease protein [Actinacidiphila bryophytorum]
MRTLRQAVHAEWTKVRTLPGLLWLLAAVVVLTAAVSAGTAAAVRCPAAGCTQDPGRISLTGVQFGQAGAAVLAVLLISGEYGTGMIRTTVTAVPRRTVVLAAKAAVLAGLLLVAGVLAVGGSVLAGRLILPGHGFTGFSPAHGPVFRAAAGSVLYLVLVGLLSLGVATAVRDAAAAVGVVLGLLYLFPILASVVSDPDWYRRLEQVAPMTAGLAVQTTITSSGAPIGPLAGLAVLAAWSSTSLLTALTTLHTRDT